MQRKHYIKLFSKCLQQKIYASSFVFHLIYASLYPAGKNCFPTPDNLIWLGCFLALEYYSVSSVQVKDLQNQSKSFITRAQHWYVSRTFITSWMCVSGRRMNHPVLPLQDWRDPPQTTAEQINLLELPGNLQRLFLGEIETPFARSLPVKGILNQSKPGHENSATVPCGSRQSWSSFQQPAFRWMFPLSERTMCIHTQTSLMQEWKFKTSIIQKWLS